MPGIDRSRIVGKDEEDLDDLTCSICHDILENPVIAQCCRQSFCTICINQWLIDNNTCPIDRQKLSVQQLLPASRMVINILNKLNVKCVNYGNNCQTIVKFVEMANHMKTCITCDSCKALKKLLSDKQKENEMLEIKIKDLVKFNSQLSKSLDKLNEVDELKKLLCEKQTELDKIKQFNPSKNISKRNEVDAVNYARKSLRPSTDHEINITINEKDHLINISKMALMETNSFFQISKQIHNKIKTHYELKPYNWVVMVVFKEDPYTSYTVFHKRMNITFGGLTIRFSAHRIDLPERDVIETARSMLNDAKIIKKAKINKGLSDWVLKESLAILMNHNSFERISKELQEKLVNKTNGNWLVMIVNSQPSEWFIHNKFVIIEIGPIVIQAYQLHNNNVM